MATEEEVLEAAAVPAAAGGGGDDAEMPDAASSSDSDEEGAGGADELRIQALEPLQEQPLDYETHVQVSFAAPQSRKGGPTLRVVRAQALTQNLDVKSINLWQDYLDYVEEHDPSVSQCTTSGLSKMRDLFERAITAGGGGGAACYWGSKLWAAYRDYEMAILITISDVNDEEKAKQVQRIRTLFHRQLPVPLAEMESTLSENKSWEAEQGNANDPGSNFDGVPSNVISSYKKANEQYVHLKLTNCSSFWRMDLHAPSSLKPRTIISSGN